MALVTGAWSDADVATLRTMFENGADARTLAICLRRKGSSVANKLVQQGLLVYFQGNYIKPWVGPDGLKVIDDLAVSLNALE